MTALLRAPQGAREVAADVVRVLALVGIPIAALAWSVTDVATIALASFATVLPRVLHVRPVLDVAFAVTVTVAAWSAVLGLYESMRWWDLPVHLVLTGLLALLAAEGLRRLGVLPPVSAVRRPLAHGVVVTASLGLALGVVWELAEWFALTFLDPATYVGYEDTLGDLALGGLGAALAGLLPPRAVTRDAG